MLTKLRVRNLAVVEEVDITFAKGLTVLTGETGAGKSVLMGALSFVLGARADGTLVREGAAEAEVEAVFDDAEIRRTVTRDGRSRAWIGEESVSLQELRAFAINRVDLHGPRANQRLLEDDFQREMLDRFGSINRAPYEKAYTRLKQLRERRAMLGEAMSEEELDFLRFQINELKAAELTIEDDSLAERHAAAAHAEEIVENANAVTEGLGGDHGAASILAALQPGFARMAKHFPPADEWRQTAEDITMQIQELSRTVADAISRFDRGGEDLAALDARLTTINRLKRKYKVNEVSRLLAVLEEKEARLASSEGRDEALAELDQDIRDTEAQVRALGEKLTAARRRAAAMFVQSLEAELRELGFLRARFEVHFEAAEISASGLDRIVYFFGPNPGEPARPLAAIASSGEIARVMLALKVVLPSGCTSVFDEIDANIGGEIGKIVGAKLRAVAKNHQVVAITHLPQSAVFGEKHLVVSKSVKNRRTKTTVAEVVGEARISEIARMLGGEQITSVVKKHAEELLEISR